MTSNPEQALAPAGAGGSWPRIGEVDDPEVEPQQAPNSCGPACARIVFRMLAAHVPTHDELYERTGRKACDVAILANAMNECTGSTAHWTGQGLNVEDTPPY